MFRLIKKHLKGCKESSEAVFDKCSKGKLCPFYAVYPDPEAPARRRKKSLETANYPVAIAKLRQFEADCYAGPKEPPKTLDAAIVHFLATKKHRSKDRQRKLRVLLGRMSEFLKQNFGHELVTQVRKTDLEAYLNTWEGSYLTLKRNRELVKSFWKYCFDSDFRPKNVAAALPTIGDERQGKDRRIPTFTPDEITRIFAAFGGYCSVYPRQGDDVARQVKAFTLVQRYTGLSIGDTAKLKKDEVSGTKIMTARKKTGEPVWTAVPQFVVDALNAAPHDSDEHFFWSGRGELHTRTSKWHERLQRLFVLAGIRILEREKYRRSGGKKKQKPEMVRVSTATPHMWRHTFVRDLYLQDTPVEDIADLLGDDPATVREYYSCFDYLRQQKLVSRVEKMWSADPLTKQLSLGARVAPVF
jgi:integrase